MPTVCSANVEDSDPKRNGISDASCQFSNVIAYVSPYSHETNNYLENFRRELITAGVAVKSPECIWRGAAFFHSGPRFVFLNWFEDRVLSTKSGSCVIDWIGFCYKLLAIQIQGVKIIWVRHNYRPHGQTVPNWFANLVLRLLCSLSTKTVVHSKSVAFEKNWHYLPHPLYEIPEQESFQVKFTDVQLENRVAVIGQVRPSKGLLEMLQTWPADVSITIAGQPSDSDYSSAIEAVIADRNLDAVTIFRNLSDCEFNTLIQSSRAVYVANPDETMIVSGVFFHAASLGTPIILNRSAFATEISELCSFAVQVDSSAEIASALSVPFPSKCAIIEETQHVFGSHRFTQCLTKILASPQL